MFDNPDWGAVFIPETPLLEILVRGSLVYLALFFLLRMILKRESGMVGITDLLVVVLIADAAQNAMGGSYGSVPDGVLLVAVIIGWAWLLNALSYWFPAVRRLTQPRPLPLIKDGKLLPKNMRREFVTREELDSHLREQGVDDISSVKEARIERGGRVSVITH